MQACLSIAQAGDALSVSRTTIYKLMDSGQIRSLKIGDRRVIPSEEIRRFVEDRMATSAAAVAA